MNMTTVWACKACGLTGIGDRCRSCGGSLAQVTEADALRRFQIVYEPTAGWYDDATLRREWARSGSTE